MQRVVVYVQDYKCNEPPCCRMSSCLTTHLRQMSVSVLKRKDIFLIFNITPTSLYVSFVILNSDLPYSTSHIHYKPSHFHLPKVKRRY